MVKYTNTVFNAYDFWLESVAEIRVRNHPFCGFYTSEGSQLGYRRGDIQRVKASYCTLPSTDTTESTMNMDV